MLRKCHRLMVMVKAKKLELGTLVNVHTISLDFFFFYKSQNSFFCAKNVTDINHLLEDGQTANFGFK